MNATTNTAFFLKELDDASALRTSLQAAQFEMTPLAFGSYMKAFVKDGLVVKAEIEEPNGDVVYSYHLTEAGRALLAPPSPAKSPKKSAPKEPANFINGEVRHQKDGVYTVCPKSPARFEQLGFREVGLEALRPFVVARAMPRIEKLALGEAAAVEVGAGFFAKEA